MLAWNVCAPFIFRRGSGPLQNYGAAPNTGYIARLPSINSRPSFAMPKLCEPFFRRNPAEESSKEKTRHAEMLVLLWRASVYFRFLRPRLCSSHVDSILFFLSQNLQALIYRLSRFVTTPGIYQVNSLLTLLPQHNPRSGGWIRICVDM